MKFIGRVLLNDFNLTFSVIGIHDSSKHRSIPIKWPETIKKETYLEIREQIFQRIERGMEKRTSEGHVCHVRVRHPLPGAEPITVGWESTGSNAGGLDEVHQPPDHRQENDQLFFEHAVRDSSPSC